MIHKHNLTTPQIVIIQTLSVTHQEENQHAIKILPEKKKTGMGAWQHCIPNIAALRYRTLD